jgi:hypothetical protein
MWKAGAELICRVDHEKILRGLANMKRFAEHEVRTIESGAALSDKKRTAR